MKIYGLVGFPLEHSFSKKYFFEKFSKENIEGEYQNFEIEKIEYFSSIFDSGHKIGGLNITIPYKEKVVPYLSELSKEAQDIGAVNVVKIENRDGHVYLTGHNTDVVGFMESLKPHVRSIHNKALILGTGGASKAVQYALNLLNISFKLVSRYPQEGRIAYVDLTRDLINESLLIINTTPLGMYPNLDTFPDLPYESITNNHILYDLVYNPPVTRFLKKGKEKGATIINGKQMLEIQAERAWEIWNS